MSKSIAELRASQHAALPERVMPICLAQALVAEVQQLDEERAQIIGASRSDDDQPGRPKRQGDGKDPRLKEIEARFDELAAEMAEHTGELRLRAISGGEWRRWVDAHPAREVGREEGRIIFHPIDNEIAYGICNAVDLFAALDTFVVSWNGEPLGEGDWDFVANRAAGGDLNEVCRQIVQMHEAVGRVAPLSRRRLSPTTPAATASN